jgi:uncharacterized RDD family membrane protein YckC
LLLLPCVSVKVHLFLGAVKYAGFWRRASAHTIDSLILNLAAWLVGLVLFAGMYGVYWILSRSSGATLKPFSDAFDPFLTQVADAVIYLLLCAPYYIWLQFRFAGATPGKKWMKIRVVRAADGSPITLRQSTVRFFAYALSYLTLGCGFLMAAFNPEKRALHDLIAGTASVIPSE